MIITNECRATNKLGLLLELTRADECLCTMIECEYDALEQVEITEETLEYLGLELELKRNPDREFGCCQPLFDELETLCECLANEIQNNDWIIHRNKKYGYEEELKYYKEEKMVL